MAEKKYAPHTPNILTLIRLLLVPVAVILVANEDWTAAALVLILGGLVTDIADGHIAKTQGIDSQFGYHFDAQTDRLMLLAPIWGMVIADDIPVVVALILTVGLYLADRIARYGKWEAMRAIWWPLCYGTIGYGLIQHASTGTVIATILLFVVASAVILYIKRDEVKRVKDKFV